MKKYITILVAIALMLASCTLPSDDNEINKGIVGIWQSGEYTLEFKSNLTFILITSSDRVDGTYSYSNNILSMTAEGSTHSATVTFSENAEVMYFIVGEKTTVYTRV